MQWKERTNLIVLGAASIVTYFYFISFFFVLLLSVFFFVFLNVFINPYFLKGKAKTKLKDHFIDRQFHLLEILA